uniref:Palmitoyltransferase n=1 Tax=Spongospora subterranea TaxID=70186 RepID=A0A0H5RQ23_9EUKA|eukprot:CRZ10794.1 hypothetical protein [Spongospora subterranea]
MGGIPNSYTGSITKFITYVVPFAIIFLCWSLVIVILFCCVLEDQPGVKNPGKFLRLTRCIQSQSATAERLFRRIFGEYIHHRTKTGINYLLRERNPAAQALYMTLMIVVLFTTFSSCSPYLNAQARFLFVALYSACWATFCWCCTSTPGVITESNHEQLLKQFPYDRLLFVPGQLCRSCKFTKVARSKHCSLCNVCVSRFDHHCVFLNVCIGGKNVHKFLLFLLVKSLSSVYMAFLLFQVLFSIVAEKELLTRRLVNSAGQPLPNNALTITRYLLGHHLQICLLQMLVLPTAIMITMFLGFHILILTRNQTTNEYYKIIAVKSANDRAIASKFYYRAAGGFVATIRAMIGRDLQ